MKVHARITIKAHVVVFNIPVGDVYALFIVRNITIILCVRRLPVVNAVLFMRAYTRAYKYIIRTIRRTQTL